MIHPQQQNHATLSITNTGDNLEAVREWVMHMDDRRQTDEALDAIGRGYEDHRKRQADADAWMESSLVKKRYRRQPNDD